MNRTIITRIMLADAQPVFREGIKRVLSDHENTFVIEEAGNIRELGPALATFHPDILILDYNPVYFDSDELNHALAVIPDCRIIIISSQQKKMDILKSLEFNVYCYLTKECRTADIHHAIHAALHGEKYFCTFVVDILLDDRKNPAAAGITAAHLTGREIEIIRLIASGKGNKEMATLLNLSGHTIHTHRRNIMKKLQLHSVAALCNFAMEKGII
ncbi:response regulator transcription factor [Chitinophaga nivalis]|uniref:Response regulator transcription factor n=1 Tax=Chitinophaga nivalis TaxID=2991709 RepID=A0ABT3IQ89_9BACT|nr:response regulator transcription factor [Chitinophaga nivalis]MCW3464212.1 response regulator transcription factor [Chitinophaga nivalis]MCW3486098.1 response regulator transcription factor [Chitinophaga nivalis]